MNRLIPAVTMAVLVSACVSHGTRPEVTEGNTVTPGSVLHSSPLDTVAVDFSDFDMLAMSPEMIAFLDEKVGDSKTQSEQLRRLARAIMRSGDFSLAYHDSTGTAAETFANRRGNCMGFTNLFVAMTRHLGIHASFQEVDVPPTWSMNGDSFLYSQHINVYIDLKQGRTREVDFNIYEFNHDLETRVVSDERARAHYFNNIGAEHMLDGETGLSYAYFRQSLLEDIEYAPAWINMGVLHRREALPDYAEVSFIEALSIDGDRSARPADLTHDVGWMSSLTDDTALLAMSNLANLYEDQGRTELAERYFAKVHAHRMKNPFYRYQMAELAFSEGDYEAAIEDLRYAIRRHRNEDEFYYLLSLSYLMQGDREEAAEWMAKAKKVAQENSEKERYSYKLDLLQNLDEN